MITEDLVAQLLHATTGMPYPQLRDAVARLTPPQRQKLELLAGQILDDARAIGPSAPAPAPTLRMRELRSPL